MANHHKEGISGPHFMGEETIKIPVNNRAKKKPRSPWQSSFSFLKARKSLGGVGDDTQKPIGNIFDIKV